MPRNSGGTYTRPDNSFSDPVLGEIIDPTAADALFDDQDEAFTDSLSRTGQGAMLADLELGGFAVVDGETGADFEINLDTSIVNGALPGANFPALTGDVTTNAGSLATTIGAGAVTNDMLAGSIAASKLAGSIPASKLVGTDIATVGTITAGVWNGTDVAVADGGTGASIASDARTNLGLGSIATQDANNVTITGGTITGMPTPTVNSDVANKAYADSIASGISPRASVALATTANITLSGEQTIDGVLTSTTRILVKNQSAPAENGVYVTAAGGWSRATDFDTAGEMTAGAAFTVTGGSTNIGTGWVLAATVANVGTDPANFNLYQTVAGALLVASNLSDLANKSTARTNLGVAIGSDVQAFDSDLSALAANSTNGFWARTGVGTGAARTLTGTANEITVTNGDGSGVPTFSLPTTLTYSGKTVTGGTFSGPTLTNATMNVLTVSTTGSNLTLGSLLSSTLANGSFVQVPIGKDFNPNNTGIIKYTQQASASTLGLQIFGDAAQGLVLQKGGNVGIGTVAPAAQLHTTGTVRLAALTGGGSGGFLAVDGTGNVSVTGTPATVYPNVYPVTCDTSGAVDATAAIQAQIDAATAAGGGIVILPAGKILVNGGLVLGASSVSTGIIIQGCGWQDYEGVFGSTTVGTTGTYIRQTTTSNSVFTIRADATHVTFRDFAFYQTQAADAPGWVPVAYPPVITQPDDQSGSVLYENILLWGVTKGIQIGTAGNGTGRTLIDGLWGKVYTYAVNCAYNGDVTRLNNCHIYIGFIGNGGPSTANADAYIAANASAFLFQRSDNPQLTNIFTYGYKYGIEISFAVGPAPDFFDFTTSLMQIANCGFDFCGSAAIFIHPDATTAGITGPSLQISNCYVSGSASGPAFDLQAPKTRVQAVNLRFQDIHQEAIKVTGADSRIDVSNVSVSNWSRASSGGFAAFDADTDTILALDHVQFQPGVNSTVETHGAGRIEGIWRAFTPTITGGTSFVSANRVGKYIIQNGAMSADVTFDVTTAGTGLGFILIAGLPFDPLVDAAMFGFLTGSSIALTGTCPLGQSDIFVFKYDGTYPGVNSTTVRVQMVDAVV